MIEAAARLFQRRQSKLKRKSVTPYAVVGRIGRLRFTDFLECFCDLAAILQHFDALTPQLGCQTEPPFGRGQCRLGFIKPVGIV